MWLHLFSQAKIQTELDLQDAFLSDDSIFIFLIAILWTGFTMLSLIKVLSNLDDLNFLTVLYLSSDLSIYAIFSVVFFLIFVEISLQMAASESSYVYKRSVHVNFPKKILS